MSTPGDRRRIDIVAAPSSLGLRPASPGHEPGAWRAPKALLSAGLVSRLDPVRVVELPHPAYEFEAQPATRIRNGVAIREHALVLADVVGQTLEAGRFALVLGGDCSILLGCLLGARRGGHSGLIHVDGHSDFSHPGNYDTASTLGAVAGMDLALATGRGELLLTHWPAAGIPLVPDDDAIQVGDRESPTPDGPGFDAVPDTSIRRFTVQQVLQLGTAEVSERVAEHLERRGLERAWIHVDLDVLDQRVMPAVDSPGSPGLGFAQLADLISRLVATGRPVGMDVTIYDPELDPHGTYPGAIVECIASSLAAIGDRPAVPTGAGGTDT